MFIIGLIVVGLLVLPLIIALVGFAIATYEMAEIEVDHHAEHRARVARHRAMSAHPGPTS